MNDARHILRYLFPGLATVFCCIFVKYEFLLELKEMATLFGSLEKAVATLALSGVLGWILSAIYFSITPISVLDHRSIFEQANVVVERNGQRLNSPQINKRMAMVMVESIWQAHKSQIKYFDSAEKLSGRYASVTHGLGTTVIGYVVVLFLYVFKILSNSGITWPGLIIWLIFFIPSFISFYFARKTHTAYINTILVSYLLNKYSENERIINYVE